MSYNAQQRLECPAMHCPSLGLSALSQPHLYSDGVAVDDADAQNRDLIDDRPTPGVIAAATVCALRAAGRAVEAHRQEALVCAIALHEPTF